MRYTRHAHTYSKMTTSLLARSYAAVNCVCVVIEIPSKHDFHWAAPTIYNKQAEHFLHDFISRHTAGMLYAVVRCLLDSEFNLMVAIEKCVKYYMCWWRIEPRMTAIQKTVPIMFWFRKNWVGVFVQKDNKNSEYLCRRQRAYCMWNKRHVFALQHN